MYQQYYWMHGSDEIQPIISDHNSLIAELSGNKKKEKQQQIWTGSSSDWNIMVSLLSSTLEIFKFSSKDLTTLHRKKIKAWGNF